MPKEQSKKKKPQSSQVLESGSLDRGNQDKLVSERLEEEKCGEGKKQSMGQSLTSCVIPGGGSVMALLCMSANGTGSLVFTDEMTEVSG